MTKNYIISKDLGIIVMRLYEGLHKKLKEKNIKISELTKLIGLSSRTIVKINKNEPVANAVMKRISSYFCCLPEELYKDVSNNIVLRTLQEEKEAKISGGLYHELQIRMTYNSNHIEGSKLSEDQTRMIFETNTLDAGDGVMVDDILETIHHFRAIDYCIDEAEHILSEEFIKKLHYILKHDTKDSLLSWFNVGEYKKRANFVGDRKTAAPEDVSACMKKLISEYNNKKNITFEDIISFHVEFERIHPFQDGNGRVGRLIAFKECLKNDIVPFIIEDSKKAFYYRGLSLWDKEKGYLEDTCLDGQDIFKALLDYFKINYQTKEN